MGHLTQLRQSEQMALRFVHSTQSTCLMQLFPCEGLLTQFVQLLYHTQLESALSVRARTSPSLFISSNSNRSRIQSARAVRVSRVIVTDRAFLALAQLAQLE